MQDTVSYVIKEKLYLNITNRGTIFCSFCIRNSKNGVGGVSKQISLWLK